MLVRVKADRLKTRFNRTLIGRQPYGTGCVLCVDAGTSYLVHSGGGDGGLLPRAVQSDGTTSIQFYECSRPNTNANDAIDDGEFVRKYKPTSERSATVMLTPLIAR